MYAKKAIKICGGPRHARYTSCSSHWLDIFSILIGGIITLVLAALATNITCSDDCFAHIGAPVKMGPDCAFKSFAFTSYALELEKFAKFLFVDSKSFLPYVLILKCYLEFIDSLFVFESVTF